MKHYQSPRSRGQAQNSDPPGDFASSAHPGGAIRLERQPEVAQTLTIFPSYPWQRMCAIIDIERPLLITHESKTLGVPAASFGVRLGDAFLP